MSKYKVKTGKQAEEVEMFCMKARHFYNRGRKKYSQREDAKLIQYVLDNNRYLLHTSGNIMWKKLEKLKIMDRTWQSMRDRYLRYILPNIDEYEIGDENRLLLKGQLNYTEVALEGSRRPVGARPLSDEFDDDVEPDDDEISITDSDTDELDRQLLRQAEETRKRFQGERSTGSLTSWQPVAKRSESTRSNQKLQADDDPSSDDCDLQLLTFAEAKRQKVFSSQSSEATIAAERSAVVEPADHQTIRNAVTATRQSGKTKVAVNRKSRDELLPVVEVTALDKLGPSERSDQTSLTLRSSTKSKRLRECESNAAAVTNNEQTDKPKPTTAKTSQPRNGKLPTNGTVSLVGLERVVSSKESPGKKSTASSVDGNGASCSNIPSTSSMSWHSVNTHNSSPNIPAVTMTDYSTGSDSSPNKTHSIMTRRSIASDSSTESTRKLNKTAKLTIAYAGKNRLDGSKASVESLSNVSTEQRIDSASVAKTVSPATFSITDAAAVQKGSALRSSDLARLRRKKGDDRLSLQSLANFVMEETSDSETSSQQQPTSDNELPETLDIQPCDAAELVNKCNQVKDVAKWLGLDPVHFLHVLCMTNGDVDDAIYWVQNGSLPSGKPIWDPIEDDRKLMNVDDDTLKELVDKYGSDAVAQRVKFLSFRM